MTPRRVSLVLRLALASSLLLAGTVALCGWLWWRTLKDRLEGEWQSNLAHESRTAALRVQGFVSALALDARYLANTPATLDYASNAESAAKDRVAETFHARMRGKESYAQVRLISKAGNGHELVRLNQDATGIHQTPQEQLQQKGDRDYIQDNVALARDAVYLSELNLNQDFGGITEPYEPTLRAVAAVYARDGTHFGWIVINANLNPLLRSLGEQQASAVRLYVANGVGSWLVHPTREARFGADLKTDWNAQAPSALDHAEFAKDYLHYVAKWPVQEASNRYITVRTGALQQDVLMGLAAARRQSMGTAAVVALVGIALTVLMAWLFLRRLRRVAEALRSFDEGAAPQRLPETPRDELGELAAAFNKLSERVTTQVTGLRQAREEADAASQAKEDFLGVMAHEVRTPLNAVTGLLRVLERNQPAPHQEPVLRSLRAATGHLTGLLNEALDWSRLRAGFVEYRHEAFALLPLLTDLELAHRPLAAQKAVIFETQFSPNLPRAVSSDAARLRQILGNLLSNAVKFTDQGNIHFSASWANDVLTCEIQDTGIGIREEDIGRIFSPFDQAGGDIARRFGGTGLGLSITRGLVEGLGGSLQAASGGKGTGSAFTLTLPCPRAEWRPDEPEISPPKLTGQRLLIVEDSPTGREVLASLLEDTGAVLALAADGAEALNYLRDGLPLAAALFDLQLPDTNGIVLATEAKKIRPSLPIIAVTAQVSPDTRTDCLAAGMHSLVPKPVEPSPLYAALRACLPEPTDTTSHYPNLFPSEPARRQRVLLALAMEFENAVGTLKTAVVERDIPAIKRLKHQLHTALHTLELADLQKSLHLLEEGHWDAGKDAETALQLALHALRTERTRVE